MNSSGEGCFSKSVVIHNYRLTLSYLSSRDSSKGYDKKLEGITGPCRSRLLHCTVILAFRPGHLVSTQPSRISCITQWHARITLIRTEESSTVPSNFKASGVAGIRRSHPHPFEMLFCEDNKNTIESVVACPMVSICYTQAPFGCL